MEKPDFKSVTNMAETHVRHERHKLELSKLKENIFNESHSAERAFDKIMEKLPSDIANDCKIELENLLYAIGRIRGYTVN